MAKTLETDSKFIMDLLTVACWEIVQQNQPQFRTYQKFTWMSDSQIVNGFGSWYGIVIGGRYEAICPVSPCYIEAGATNLRFKLDVNRVVSAWLVRGLGDGKTSLISLPSWPSRHSVSVKMPCRNPVYSVALFCFNVRPSVRLPDHVSKTPGLMLPF